MRHESTGRPRHLDRFVVVLVALILCAAFAIVARPVPSIFDNPLEEDGYYIMAIARWIALGHGVTYDGESLSNGFQPLWTFLCAPFFWLADGDRVTGIRCALGLHGLFYALGALMTAHCLPGSSTSLRWDHAPGGRSPLWSSCPARSYGGTVSTASKPRFPSPACSRRSFA